jgi:CHAT domain-containing protein/tetratricopeptide (TPR) repeat protein
MYQLIYSIALILLMPGCMAHQDAITLPENNEHVVKDKNQIKNFKKNISPERQHWKELINQAGRAYQSRNYSQGIVHAEKAYKYALNNFGKIDQDTLTSISKLALLYQSQGRYGEAEPLYKLSLQLREELLGPNHPSTLTSINNLAELYRLQGRYDEAEPLHKRCLQLCEEFLGPNNQLTLTSINNLALLYESQGRYDEAEPLFIRCLQGIEKILGPKHPKTLFSINNLATLYEYQGKYGEAEPLYKRFYKLSEEVLGPNHPSTLTSINNLAGLYKLQGRYGEAEPLYKRCLQLREEVLGPKHSDTLTSINNLAVLYEYQEMYGEAEPLYKRCLQFREEILGPKHPDTLGSINNLAGLYHSQGRYDEAEPLYQRCFQLNKEVLGPKHPNLLRSINNLAVLYESQGRYAEAEPLYQRFYKLSEEVLGPKHPSTLTSINNFAGLYKSQGRYDKANQFYKRCLQLREEVLGTKHPDTLSTLLSYSACLVMLKQENQALLQLKKLELSLRHYAGDILKSTQQLRVRRKFMMSKSNFQDVLFTLAFQSKYPSILAFAGDVILRWKCVQEEAETIMNRLIHSSQDPRIIQLGQNINSLRRQMSIFNPKVDMNALIQELEQQEVKLAQLSNSYQDYLNKSNVGMDDLKQMLPPKTAVIELKQYHHYNFKTDEFEGIRLAAVLLLPNASQVLLKDLGPMKEIFAKVRIAKNQQEKTPALKQLYSILFGVFDKHIAKAETIYISPDGLTHNISFSSLILPDGRFWIERQNLCRIQTSRDLLDSTKPINKGTLVAMGGIDYNQFPDNKLKAVTKASDHYGYTRSIKSTAEKIESFDSLQFSKIEVENIKMFYQLSQQKMPLIFRGTNASEYQLKHMKAPPHILHLSTHGFYMESSEDVTERPMLLSGLALAGCNLGLKGKKGPDNEDGILYAIEVAGLDLSGTELVVLSACDTGKGTIDYSEGVYGLLRAFRLAGAQNIMMTLWSLQDQSASEFLTSFYKTWLRQSNMTPLKALRKTQLSFIKQNKDSKLWAPYVMVGGTLQ